MRQGFRIARPIEGGEQYVVRMWQEVGLHADTASDSQALIQLKKVYCDRKDCLRCRIGYEYLKGKKVKK